MQDLVSEEPSVRWHSRCRKAAFEGVGTFPQQAIYKNCAEQNFRKHVNRALFTLLAKLLDRLARNRSFKISIHADFGSISKCKSRGPPFSRRSSADELLNYVRLRSRKSTCHKVASRANLYKFTHFRRSARWPYPQKLLAGGSIPSPL